VDRIRLREILTRYFDAGELRTLCFDLGVDYDSLPGEGKASKARELVAYLERHSRLPELVEMGKQQRPDVPWVDTPEAAREAPFSPQSASPESLRAEIESLRRQLAEEEQNLLLIEERKSQYVMDVEVPLQVVKQEQAQRKKIADLRARLAELETAATGGRPPVPADASRDSLRAQLEMAEKTLFVYERQAAGYTTLTIPAPLAVNLEEQREKVTRLRAQLAALED